MKKNLALLPIANRATECLLHIFNRQNPLCERSPRRELLNVAFGAVAANKVERNIAYDPFDFFWGNPDEPKHSRLLWYFINPHEEHGCGTYLLRRFLSALKISEVELTVDGNCEVTREDEHIDLLITRDTADGKYAIIIENKVNGAIDQRRQLQTYYGVMRQRGFDDEQIFVCYLTLRGGSPSNDSVGSIRTRITKRTFKEHIVPWLEGVLRDRDKWPVNMPEGMSDNLKHYLNLIKWRLNEEKIMQINEKIFNALQSADEANRLPTFEEIIAVTESAQALERCYRRLKRAKTVSAVRQVIQERYKVRQTHAWHIHDEILETTDWHDDFYSQEYWFGFSVGGMVIVALGEDKDGIISGYGGPTSAGKVKRFEKFVRKEEPSLFDGTPYDFWYSYTHHTNVHGTQPSDVPNLADRLLHMYRNMERLVAKFKSLPKSSN